MKNLKELEVYIAEIDEKYKESQSNKAYLDSEFKKYENERLNSEGLSQNAHLKVVVNRIELQSNANNINNPQVIVRLDNYNQTVKSLNRSGSDINFEREMDM